MPPASPRQPPWSIATAPRAARAMGSQSAPRTAGVGELAALVHAQAQRGHLRVVAVGLLAVGVLVGHAGELLARGVDLPGQAPPARRADVERPARERDARVAREDPVRRRDE